MGYLKDFTIVGINDEYLGEKIVMFYVDGSTTENVEQLLYSFCKANLAEYKRPDEFVKIDVLPRSTNGKIFREVLKKNYLNLKNK